MADMTTAGLRPLQPQRVLEKASLEVDVGKIPKYNGREIPEMFEEIREYLTSLRGFTKIQLPYIICNTLIPPLSANVDETNYVNKDAEMIVCAPILEKVTISAANEDDLDLQATNGLLDLNELIDQRVVYVVMPKTIGTHPVWKFTAGQRRSKLCSVAYWICYNTLLGKGMVEKWLLIYFPTSKPSHIEENQGTLLLRSMRQCI